MRVLTDNSMVVGSSGAGVSDAARPKKREKPALVEIHDRQQLEIRFSYALGGESKEQRYEVDTYFFIPRNVGVNRAK